MFIVIEGIDGCGKTKVAEELKKKLEEKGYKVFLTREPFNTKIKELIRSIIKEDHPKTKYFGLSLACLFAADRYLHQIEIEERLKQNFIVISDRYYHSSFSYQSNYEAFNLRWLKILHKYIIKPDFVFILDVPVEVALERIKDRSEKTSYETLEFLRKVREKYLKLPKLLKDEKIFIIDNSGNIEETINKILSIIRL